jgi:HlyD family secretion protein
MKPLRHEVTRPRRHEVTKVMALALAMLAAACGTKDDPSQIQLNGRLEAQLVDLAPKVSGRVVNVLVKEGERVKAGDLLVELDLGDTALAVERDRHNVQAARARLQDMAVGSREAEIAAAAAEVADKRAAVELADRDLQRQEYLLSKEVGAPRDYDRAKTELERAQASVKIAEERLTLTREGFRRWQTAQAKSEVDRAQAQLAQSEVVARESEIRAPADGVVMHRMAEPGQLLAAGQVGITMALSNRLYVRTFVPETRLGRIKPGQTATVKVDAHPGQTFAATVSEISPDPEFTPKPVETKNERVNLVYAAKVDLVLGWNAPLVPGQPADVHVAVSPAPAAQAASQPSAQERNLIQQMVAKATVVVRQR